MSKCVVINYVEEGVCTLETSVGNKIYCETTYILLPILNHVSFCDVREIH